MPYPSNLHIYSTNSKTITLNSAGSFHHPVDSAHELVTREGKEKKIMGLTPNIFDVARIERLLKSINAKLETMESVMLEYDDEIREDRNEDE